MFSSSVFSTLEKSLNGTALKQRVITNNIANSSTPNYKARQVTFQNEFQAQLKSYKSDARHIGFQGETSDGSFSVQTDQRSSMGTNGNNVDVDKEMAELAKNQILNQALVQRINGKFNSLKMVVKGGR